MPVGIEEKLLRWGIGCVVIPPLQSRNRFDQLGRFYFKGVRELNNVQQSEVALAALDSSDVVPVQVGQLRQLLLGKATFDSQFAESFTE